VIRINGPTTRLRSSSSSIHFRDLDLRIADSTVLTTADVLNIIAQEGPAT